MYRGVSFAGKPAPTEKQIVDRSLSQARGPENRPVSDCRPRSKVGAGLPAMASTRSAGCTELPASPASQLLQKVFCGLRIQACVRARRGAEWWGKRPFGCFWLGRHPGLCSKSGPPQGQNPWPPLPKNRIGTPSLNYFPIPWLFSPRQRSTSFKHL